VLVRGRRCGTYFDEVKVHYGRAETWWIYIVYHDKSSNTQVKYNQVDYVLFVSWCTDE
jgi:hypothetical protein